MAVPSLHMHQRIVVNLAATLYPYSQVEALACHILNISLFVRTQDTPTPGTQLGFVSGELDEVIFGSVYQRVGG